MVAACHVEPQNLGANKDFPHGRGSNVYNCRCCEKDKIFHSFNLSFFHTMYGKCKKKKTGETRVVIVRFLRFPERELVLRRVRELADDIEGLRGFSYRDKRRKKKQKKKPTTTTVGAS